jgi:hypothetical protein
MTKQKSGKASWNDVKHYVSTFDRAGLIDLLHDLYDASADNRAFLHARFGAGTDVLEPYKRVLERWLWPDVTKPNQDVSVSKALNAISSYKKAVGDPEGLLDLMVLYCERAAGFTYNFGMEGDSWFSALIRTFGGALELAASMDTERRAQFVPRLRGVQNTCSDLGWGVGDAINDLWSQFEVESADLEQ